LSVTPPVVSLEQLWRELWVSLDSLLRSYTAVHGLSSSKQATVESDGKRILVRFGTKWLELRREGSQVSWQREDGRSGDLELTEAGRLLGSSGEVEMDMAAEAWARELMQ
jgi:hypothetical protein